MWGELALSLKSGNIYMIIIMGMAFIACMMVFERFLMLQFYYNLDFTRFLTELKKMVRSEDYERAMNLCKTASRAGLPRIALRALEAAENDPTTIKGTIEEDVIDFLPRLESRLAVMPAFATFVLLVGILGTIDGLWWAFHSIDVLDTAKKQAALAGGIAGSLNPTATGLVASMLLLISHHFLKSMAVRIVEKVHYGVAVIYNLLVPEEITTVVAAAGVGQQEPRETSDAIVENPADEPSAQDEGLPVDDAFDDAVVDDIKDEEEII